MNLRVLTAAIAFALISVELASQQNAGLLTQQTRGQFDEALYGGPVFSFGAVGLTLSDTDGDGDLDVVVAADTGGGGSQVYLFENDGRGRFASHRPLAIASFGRIVASDLNGDGIGDFVAGGDVWLSVAAETWVSVPYPLSDYPEVDGFGDIDGDGDPDMVLPGQPMRVVRNDGNAFTDVSAAWSNNLSAGRVTLGDVDVDGDLDVFTESDLLLFDSALQRFVSAPPGFVPAAYANGRGRLVDVDGDGDLDLLGPGLLLVNAAAGVFVDASARLPAASPPGLLFADVRDWDGDGDPDLAWGQLLENDGRGFFAAVPSFVAPRLPALPFGRPARAIGDVDGDGKPDVVAGTHGWSGQTSSTWGTLSLAINDGGRRLVEVTSRGVGRAGLGSGSGVVLDIEGDGDLDLLLSGPGLVRNDWGVFEEPVETAMPAAPGFHPGHFVNVHLRATDVDGDGDSDLVGPAPEVWINDGSGRFSDESSARVPAGLAGVNVAVGDIDDDGDPDLVVVSGGQDVVLRNDGSGFFQLVPGGLPPRIDASGVPLLEDFDGDGDFDLFVGLGLFASGDRDRLYLNDGAGMFSERIGALAPLFTTTADAIAADFDGDADVDVVDVRAGVIHFNDGTAAFTTVSLGGYLGQIGAALDADEDGDVDLVVAAQASVVLHENDGTGRFTAAPSAVGRARMGEPVNLLPFDCDGDGDLDLVVTSIEGFQSPNAVDLLLLNRLRDLRSYAHPRLGEPYSLEVSALRARHESQLAFVLVGAPLQVRPLLAPFGRLAVDLTGAGSIGFLILTSAAPVQSLQIVVPTNLALLGSEFAFQALVGPAANFVDHARLTNAIVEPILY